MQIGEFQDWNIKNPFNNPASVSSENVKCKEKPPSPRGGKTMFQIFTNVHIFSDFKSLDGCRINWFFFMSSPENRVSRCVRKGWISGGLQGWSLLIIDILIPSPLRFQCDLFLVRHNRLRRPQCQLHRERRTISNGQWGNLHIRTVLRLLLDIIRTNLPKQTSSSNTLHTSIRGYLQG